MRSCQMWNQRFHELQAGYANSIKDHEKGTINYGIVNLAKDKFQLVEDVRYLWVLTKNEVTDAPGDIYVGVESPLDHPKAFHEDIQQYLEKLKQPLNESIKQINASAVNPVVKEEKIHQAYLNAGFPWRGHPTLAIKYDDKGNVLPTTVYMAGELYFKDSNWYLNNRSGRFYHILVDISFQEKEHLLELIAQQFFMHTQKSACPGIKPLIEVLSYSKSTDTLWKKYTNRNIALPNVALMIILQSFKRYIQHRQNNVEIRAKDTPEYLTIQSLLYGKNFNNLQSVVDYLGQNEFNQTVKTLFINNQVCAEELEADLKTIIKFLQTKACENITPSIKM